MLLLIKTKPRLSLQRKVVNFGFTPFWLDWPKKIFEYIYLLIKQALENFTHLPEIFSIVAASLVFLGLKGELNMDGIKGEFTSAAFALAGLMGAMLRLIVRQKGITESKGKKRRVRIISSVRY